MVFAGFFGGDESSEAPNVVSFEDIVEAHFEAKCEGTSESSNGKATEELLERWRRFAKREGEVLSSFFGQSGNTGAALTAEEVIRSGRRVSRGRLRVHVALGLAAAGDAADLVSRYERIRVKADQLLRGAEREHVTRVLYERLCGVIRIVDEMVILDRFRSDNRFKTLDEVARGWCGEAFPGSEPLPESRSDKSHKAQVRKKAIDDANQRIANALKVAEAEVGQAEDLCDRAVRRGALMAYFVGMLAGIVIFSALGGVLGLVLSNVDISGFEAESFLTVFVGGAVGAIVSVMTRMSSEESWLEFETARSYLRLLGMFRPLIGAIFGVALYFGIESGILQFINPPDASASTFFFFAFIAFLAGFSERWASDVLLPIKGTPTSVRTDRAAEAQAQASSA